jgi:hypothetical protein
MTVVQGVYGRGGGGVWDSGALVLWWGFDVLGSQGESPYVEPFRVEANCCCRTSVGMAMLHWLSPTLVKDDV